MRTLLPAGLATGLLAATLLTGPGAQAAAYTCQGRTATVVGAGPYGLTGTEGDDVIVTNGSTGVQALGGNDLICVTGGTAFGDVSVHAGAGDDVVDASQVIGGVDVELGAGSDTYTGSAYDESVHGGNNGYSGGLSVDTERDVIATGAGGDDRVVSGSERTVANADVVVLGADDGVGFGSEVVWTGPLAFDGRLDGGGGARLIFGTGSGTGSVAVNATAGFLAEDGVTTLRWTGFDRFRTGSKATPAPARFEFLGSDRDEELEIVFTKAYESRQRIAMGGGADTLLLGDENLGARGSRYLGGPGADHVALWAGKRLDLDLQRERIKTKPAGSTFRSTFADFETQLVGAKKLVLKGTNKSDELRFYACKATVKGRGGADDIRQSRGDDYFEAGLRCNPRKFRLFGGGGKDTLQGSTGRDLLVGGPGRDTINGNRGRDTCSGEKLRSCEIKRR
jgi:hypothetical protein